jgi:hypothetical protein
VAPPAADAEIRYPGLRPQSAGLGKKRNRFFDVGFVPTTDMPASYRFDFFLLFFFLPKMLVQLSV